MDYGVVNFQWRVRPNVFGNGGWASFSNTYVVTSDLPIGPDLSAEAQLCAVSVFDQVRLIMGGDDIYCMLRTRTRQGGPFMEIDDEIALGSGGFVEAAPWWCSVLVRKYSGDPERYSKGRVYIPFVGKPIGGSPFLGDFATDFQYIADEFSRTLTAGTMTCVPVVHRKAEDDWAPVTRCDLSPFLAFQRRRNASTRYYEFP